MDVTAPVDIGSDFLGYRIEELLGRGGMGVVYRAYDLRLKRPVALKLVAPALARDERFRERFARESELVMSLEHPNVVPIYDAGDFEGHVYLAMRLVDGRDLGSLLRAEGALDPARAIAICTQIAAALDAAHARGLVHRDVKPSNVLLDRSEHVYLADFGLTRRLHDKERPPGDDRSLGTPAYLAPEQLDAGPVDGRADVYSLGCVLYECLTGEPVFPRASRLAVAWAHLEDEPPKPSLERAELPETIDAIVKRALAKEPDQRYPTCADLITALEGAFGLRTHASHRKRTLILVGAAVLAIAAAAGVVATSVIGARPSGADAPGAAPNTLVRIDPATKKLAAVVHVGIDPLVAVGSGRHVWVYTEHRGTITEVDARTGRRIEKTTVSVIPPSLCCGVSSGPVLAADASGAWFVTGGNVGKAELIHVPAGRRGSREYPLRLTPTGVAVGDDSVWIVGQTPRNDEVLRLDPANGHLLKGWTFPVSARLTAIGFAYGAAWVVSSEKSTLYRIDPRPDERIRRVVVSNSPATRPEFIGGYVWVRVTGESGLTLWFDPSSLKKPFHWEPDGPPQNEENAWAFGDLWWYDSPTGAVDWENGLDPIPGDGRRNILPIHTIPVTSSTPSAGGPCLTSITTAGGAVWATVAPSLKDAKVRCLR